VTGRSLDRDDFANEVDPIRRELRALQRELQRHEKAQADTNAYLSRLQVRIEILEAWRERTSHSDS
jgi:flagellar motility protein MotE (MotC chaperone)